VKEPTREKKLEKRLRDLKSYLKDENLPSRLREYVLELTRRFGDENKMS